MEPVVDTMNARFLSQGEVPIGFNGPALEESCEEDGYGMCSIEDIEPVYGVSHVGLMTTQAKEEH